MHPRTLQGLAQAAYANRDITSAIGFYLRAWEAVQDEPALAPGIANELAYVCLYDLSDAEAAGRWAMRMEASATNDIDLARLGLLRTRLASGAPGKARSTFTSVAAL
ncbi:hypothetical protein [Pinirhizobacter sp.]|jgi:hypothetical protein|uniref:hypothetical protein n=1 Tax=Pinirhizobacter sp. TaxID=2950432 RepID=UPI002F407172